MSELESTIYLLPDWLPFKPATIMIKRPMLACSRNITDKDFPKLRFPLYASIKLDGIRCILTCKDGKLQAFSRKLIPIPNLIVQQWAEDQGIAGLDGELIIPGCTFHEIQSWVMSEITLPRNFQFRAFDHIGFYNNNPFLQRLQMAKTLIDRFNPHRTYILPSVRVECSLDLKLLFDKMIEQGEEGLILRSPNGPYKQGRSTFNEQYMLKMKLYEDKEATVIGFEPEYENQNVQQQDKTGYSKRSSHKANLHARERLGALVVQESETGKTFQIGSGFTHEQRDEIWKHQDQYLAATVTYKTQTHGTKDLPRTPIFKGIRKD